MTHNAWFRGGPKMPSTSPSNIAKPHIMKGETIGHFQKRIQMPALTAYEDAVNSHSGTRANELSIRNPNDARFHIRDTYTSLKIWHPV